jgi:ferrochelatase
MRHWHPYIGDVVPQMLEDGVDEIVGVVMAPHFSRMSIGAYMGKLDKALADSGAEIPVHKVESWKDEPSFIDAIADRVRQALQKFPDDIRADVPILFTAHSLPARVLESGDPYPEELQTSVRLVVEQLQPKDHRWAFQSQGATAEPWLGPTVEDTLQQLADEGHRNLLLVPIGFVCDHVEVLYDLDREAADVCREIGLLMTRAESVNDDPLFLDMMADVVLRTIARYERGRALPLAVRPAL